MENTLKQFRKNASIGFEDAARFLGVGIGTLSRWERGVNPPPSNIIPRIKEVYGLTDGQVMALLESEAQRKGA